VTSDLTSLPSTADEHALHHRLLAADPVAPSDLAVAYLGYLGRYLRERNPAIDDEFCQTAAEDAIMALSKRPQSYDPARATLIAYLRLSAQGDLRSLLARERRHRSHQANLESVELSGVVGKEVGDDTYDPAVLVEARESVSEVMRQRLAIPAGVLQGLTPGEISALRLMAEGERRTPAYAQALGITDLPLTEQRHEVKRVKDRLQKRLERGRTNV